MNDIAVKKEEKKDGEKKPGMGFQLFPRQLVQILADEVAAVLLKRLPMLTREKKKTRVNNNKKLEEGIFLDTSAIIDGRIFDVVRLGLFQDVFVVLDDILLELKHIADAQDVVRRERGRKGLEFLENLKKTRNVKMVVAKQDGHKQIKEVDEALIQTAKKHRGRIITCDYNLEKKATIQGVIAINMNALANCLKITAVPGEALHIKVLHHGKDMTQGVGYLDDGTMLVVERGADDISKTIDVVVSRVIQTSSGRILFAKKI